MHKDLLKLTIEALRKICSDPSIDIIGETKIVDDLGLESIDFVDFIFELEKLTSLRLDIVQMNVSLSQGTSRRFREVKVILFFT
jgi:acyl carrier protein